METQEQNRCHLTVTGVGSDGMPMTFLQSVRVDGIRQVARAEPFTIYVYKELELGVELKLGLEFIGHYNEPNLGLVYEYSGNEDGFHALEYNPQNGLWVERRNTLT
ncbi:DHS-like NAD/FAD-binding domain-containing protein [Penicillium hordei]|uniref:DHS-like NAD/FAD-binding domain-containing protein n=1 Tax=Penicillium hordei TaxID=40994 RepID=A0AAD6DKR1_9EURO|nr:DHS-like NAD/FAD-binding domain-containing protein [Penicillium hordei]KAJ5588218.1 DHS-like NAD/FAD-binding domain-containing protein [Penicillium hordei]